MTVTHMESDRATFGSMAFGGDRAVELALVAPANRKDPYPFYRSLLEERPFHRTALGNWVVARYDDVVEIQKDGRFRGEVPRFDGDAEDDEPPGPIEIVQSKWLNFMNPPEHTRVRGLVARAFTHQVVESLRPDVERAAEQLLDRCAAINEANGSFDVIHDYAHVLPLLTISRLLGVPDDDAGDLVEWTLEVNRTLDPMLSPRGVARAKRACVSLLDRCRAVLDDRKHSPGDDVVSILLETDGPNGRLTEQEVLSSCVFIFGAGHTTTANLIGNGMLSLLRHVDQLERLRAEPRLIRPAIEEMLRFEPPIQMNVRSVEEPTEFRGEVIRPGERVIALIAAANRDPARFPDPDRMDIGRSPNPHLSFGFSTHFCLGASLARMQAQIAVGRLVQRFPRIELAATEPQWRKTINNRGLGRLPVAVSA
jgi:pimeloyl-[acyl-carrier protein] synthase